MTLDPAPILSPSELIQEGQGLVRSLALDVFRNLPVRVDLDDLIAYGQLGLIEAAQVFDPAEKTRFTTFAYYRIRGAIYDGVAKMTWTSRARLRRLRFQQMADDVLENADASNPHEDEHSPQSDAAWLGRVTERLAVVFLATSHEDSANQSLCEATDTQESPSVVFANQEQQMVLRKLVAKLPIDASRLITSIYFEGHSLTEAAARCGISKSWASRIHAKSLDQLAQNMRTLGVD